MKKIALVFIALAIALTASANEETFQWSYNRAFFDKADGFRLYMGNTKETLTTLVADIPKSSVLIVSELPIIVEEHFDTNPGTKYATSGGGSWQWVASTKNMKISADGVDFMVVFDAGAGAVNDFAYKFYPEKRLGGDIANIYSYLKDTTAGDYYELRMSDVADKDNNFRKVINKQHGGVEGTFPFPRFAQCAIKPEGETICPGFPVYISWAPGHYVADVNQVSVYGKDETPIPVNKIEIIFKNQSGWIDDVVIGGRMTVQSKASFEMTALKVWFAISAYSAYGESGKSIPTEYSPQSTEQTTEYMKALPSKPTGIIILK